MKWRIGGRGQGGPRPSGEVASAFDGMTGDADRYAFSPNVVMLEAKPGRSGMAVRAAASELVTSHIKLGRRSVAVCGAWSGVGVSFVSVNLAVALAERGVSTVLIDVNLERPSLETYIEPSRRGPGVQDFLRDEDLAIADIVHSDVLPGLSLIYAGGACQDSRELLGHTRLVELVRGCMRDYSFTILDTPPASRSASARRIASVAGYALVVARAGASHADGIRTLSRTLVEDGVEVVGAVLNGV